MIAAGYDNLMHQFIDSNPGLRSRFNKYFHFPDYTPDELMRIFRKFCADNGYTLTESAVPRLQAALNEIYAARTEHFGNARTVRNLFEAAISNQADRLAEMDDISDLQLTELSTDDFSAL